MKNKKLLVLLLAVAGCLLWLLFATLHLDRLAEMIPPSTEEQQGTIMLEIVETTNEIYAKDDPAEITTSKEEETEEELQWWNPGFWYLEYDGIEPLTEAQTLDIRKKWAEIWYDRSYNLNYTNYTRKGYSEDIAKEMSTNRAQEIYNKNLTVLFNEYYYDQYAYLGIVNGCVIFRDTNPGPIVNVQLGDVKFHNHLFILFKDGDFYWVSTAYKNGWLSDEDISTILEKNELFYDAYKEWEKDVQRRIEEKIEFGGE